MSWQSAGGKATAIISRKKALDTYYINPNICKECGKVIQVVGKVHETRVKKFCTRNCAALFNNKLRPKKIKLSKEELLHKRHQKVLEKRKDTTKKELFDKCKNYFAARCTITKLAKVSMLYSKKPKVCKCGYTKHVEVCHIKSVSEFDDLATLYEINHIDNLIYLCPNCHWEFDNQKILQDV